MLHLLRGCTSQECAPTYMPANLGIVVTFGLQTALSYRRELSVQIN